MGVLTRQSAVGSFPASGIFECCNAPPCRAVLCVVRGCGSGQWGPGDDDEAVGTGARRGGWLSVFSFDSLLPTSEFSVGKMANWRFILVPKVGSV